MDDRSPTPGVPEVLEPGIRRVLAPNPSPMTYWGTNTYLLGQGDVAVVDPGPDRPAHLRAILGALETAEQITHILVTHSHVDHSPLARALADATGAPVYAFGDSLAGRSDVMAGLAAEGLTGGGEGVDLSFSPDAHLADGDRLRVGDVVVEALWTPGHMANHLCFAVGDAVLTGDLVMGWASTMISPPDGDLTAFMASAQRLSHRPDRVYFPGHGAPVIAPQERARWLIDHRKSREAQILSALTPEPQSIADLTAAIYTDVDPRLLPAAERNVFAHLIDLTGRGLAQPEPHLSATARFFAA